MTNKTIINVIITLIVWYYCSLTINAQSFSVLFGRTPTSSKTSEERRSSTLIFPKHGRTNSEQEHGRTINESPRLFSPTLRTLRRYFEWVISYFTFFGSVHFQQKSVESQSSTYENSNPNHYVPYSYLQRDDRSTALIYLHSPPRRNASQQSTSIYYGERFHSQHPWKTRLSYGRPSFPPTQRKGSPYRSYSYNIPWSYGRPSGRTPQM